MEISKEVLSNSNNINRLTKLLNVIAKLNMNISGYGNIDVNPNSGFLYVWCEDFNFTSYIDESNDVEFMWACGYCGEEYTLPYNDDTTLEAIEEWVDSLYRNDGQHCEYCMKDEDEE